jgi:hypothetical protein
VFLSDQVEAAQASSRTSKPASFGGSVPPGAAVATRPPPPPPPPARKKMRYVSKGVGPVGKDTPLFGLVMIVKNEAYQLLPVLESVMAHIDYW